MASKNLMEVFEDIKSIDKISANAQIEGVLCSSTEMQDPKRGKKRYFRGQMSDGSKKIRLVGFDNQQQKLLHDFYVTNSPIKITECEVQRSTYSGELEIKLTGKSAIAKSPKKFETVADSSTTSSPVLIRVSEVYNKENFDKVNLNIKVLKLNDLSKLTVWEREVGKFEPGHSYEMQQMFVRVYDGLKFLSFPKDGGSYTEIDDIGTVQENVDNTQNQMNSPNDIHNTVVCGVSSFLKYRSCIKCM